MIDILPGGCANCKGPQRAKTLYVDLEGTLSVPAPGKVPHRCSFIDTLGPPIVRCGIFECGKQDGTYTLTNVGEGSFFSCFNVFRPAPFPPYVLGGGHGCKWLTIPINGVYDQPGIDWDCPHHPELRGRAVCNNIIAVAATSSTFFNAASGATTRYYYWVAEAQHSAEQQWASWYGELLLEPLDCVNVNAVLSKTCNGVASGALAPPGIPVSKCLAPDTITLRSA